MSRHTRATVVGVSLLLSIGCAWDGIDRKNTPNQSPTVEITGGAVEGRNADYRVEFFWFGSDNDGSVDHFLAAIDDTCLCTIVDTLSTNPLVVDTRKSFDAEECLAAGIEPAYESPDSIWQRVDAYSGSFNFQAATEIPAENPPFQSQDWHTFYIKAIDNRGAQSRPDSRFFNAITIAPDVRILAPVGQPPNNAAEVSPFFTIRWSGRDDDATGSNRKPVGYQLKMVEIQSVQTESEENAIDRLTNTFTFCDYPNTLIPDSLIVPMDGCTPLAEPTDSTYLPWDWYPKRTDPFPDELLRFQNAVGGDYVFGLRPVDEAGAVMPRNAFALADAENAGNLIKMDVNPNRPVNPHILITENNLLGSQNFVSDGAEWRVEVPVNLPLDFEWEVTAEHYGSRVGGVNFALDIPDPGCEVCQSEDGIGGWIGWGAHEDFGQDIIFTEEQAGEQHILYVRARDESFQADREILAVVIMDVIAFEFDRTALLVDDFTTSGFDDCEHDDVVVPMVQEAVAPHLGIGEELDVFVGHASAGPCAETSTPREIKLSRLARYKLLYWPVAAQGSGSVLARITANPGFETDTDRYLSIYMQAGGNLITWGKGSTGHLLGNFFPQEDPYEPMVPQFQNPNYGPGTFLWDVMRVRSLSDAVGRGTSRRLSRACSGIVGMEATDTALNEGFPVGVQDPTGYLDSSGQPRTAIWFDDYFGENNAFGSEANCVMGGPPMRVAGMDTLYSYVSNSWTYEAGGPDSIRTACGTTFLSPFEDRPVLIRYEDPFGRQGRYAWASTPLYVFAGNHTQDLHDIMSGLTDWIFE